MVTVGSLALAGWNWTLKEAVCPAANSSGGVMPVTWKSEPNPRIELMVTEDEVLFEIVSDSVLLLPIGTVPKFRLPLPSTTVPVPFEPPARLWQPVSSNKPPVITKKMAKRQYSR